MTDQPTDQQTDQHLHLQSSDGAKKCHRYINCRDVYKIVHCWLFQQYNHQPPRLFICGIIHLRPNFFEQFWLKKIKNIKKKLKNVLKSACPESQNKAIKIFYRKYPCIIFKRKNLQYYKFLRLFRKRTQMVLNYFKQSPLKFI